MSKTHQQKNTKMSKSYARIYTFLELGVPITLIDTGFKNEVPTVGMQTVFTNLFRNGSLSA